MPLSSTQLIEYIFRCSVMKFLVLNQIDQDDEIKEQTATSNKCQVQQNLIFVNNIEMLIHALL